MTSLNKMKTMWCNTNAYKNNNNGQEAPKVTIVQVTITFMDFSRDPSPEEEARLNMAGLACIDYSHGAGVFEWHEQDHWRLRNELAPEWDVSPTTYLTLC